MIVFVVGCSDGNDQEGKGYEEDGDEGLFREDESC